MSLIFGNFESEVNELVQNVNLLAQSDITSLDHLKNGIIISKILAKYLKKDKIEGILSGYSKEISLCNWEVILHHCQSLLPDAWKTIRAYEILTDPGLLFSITKVLLQKLRKTVKPQQKTEKSVQKPEKIIKKTEKSMQKTEKSLSKTRKQNHLHKTPSKSTEKPQKILLFKENSKSSISESAKTSIHTWLVDLQVIPPVLYLHEFLYRIRTGISLADLINRLEGKTAVIHGINKNPKNSSYCIANINKTLEFLRNIPKVKSQYLWSSLQIYEGSEKHIYGLLLDIKEFYRTRYPNFIPRSSTNRKLSINFTDFETTEKNINKKTQLRLSLIIQHSKNKRPRTMTRKLKNPL